MPYLEKHNCNTTWNIIRGRKKQFSLHDMQFLLKAYRSLFLTEVHTVCIFHVLDVFYLLFKHTLLKNAITQKNFSKSCQLY